VLLDVAAAVIWALYSTAIGYFGGTAFEYEPLVGAVVALGLALIVTLVNETGRGWSRGYGRERERLTATTRNAAMSSTGSRRRRPTTASPAARSAT
jgi:hypothetical protein